MTPDELDPVLAVMSRGVQEIQRDLGVSASKLVLAEMEVRRLTVQLEAKTKRVEKLDSECFELKERHAQITEQWIIKDQRSAKNLRRVDQLSLGVYELIERVRERRDNARTKAEGKALGHVLAELQDIYGPNTTNGGEWPA